MFPVIPRTAKESIVLCAFRSAIIYVFCAVRDTTVIYWNLGSFEEC